MSAFFFVILSAGAVILRMTTMATLATLLASVAHAQRPESPPAVKRYFSLVRATFDGQKAYDQAAFMDQYFRWPGNTGFNAAIHRVEQTLKDAGYVEESRAKRSDVLTYRIEHRPLRTPAWEPADASVTIVLGTM